MWWACRVGWSGRWRRGGSDVLDFLLDLGCCTRHCGLGVVTCEICIERETYRTKISFYIIYDLVRAMGGARFAVEVKEGMRMCK